MAESRRRSRPAGAPLVLAGFLAAAAAPAGARAEEPGYAEVEVASGGSVSGVVRALQAPPAPSPHKVTKDEEACGKQIPNESLLRAPDGGVKNAVVSIEEIAAGKPIDRTRAVRLDNTQCRFVPHVLAVAVGQRLEITNSDPVLHSAHGLMNGLRTVFNVALPIQNQKVPRTIREPGLMTVGCDAGHIWMTAYIAAFPHPYFAVTDEKGAFRIDQIPPGAYRLRAWHETLGAQLLDVTVSAGQDSQVAFEKLGK